MRSFRYFMPPFVPSLCDCHRRSSANDGGHRSFTDARQLCGMSEEATPDPFPVPASTARELLRCCPYGREAQRDAEDAIRREELPTFALYSSYQHDAGGWHTSQSKIIDDKLWRRIIADKQLDPFWKRSQVLLEWDGTVTGWDLRGIRIEPEPLIEFLARYGLAVTVDANGQLQVPGQARALTGAGSVRNVLLQRPYSKNWSKPPTYILPNIFTFEFTR